MTGPSGTSGTEPLRIGIRQFVGRPWLGVIFAYAGPGPSALEGASGAPGNECKKREAGVEAEFRLLHRRAL